MNNPESTETLSQLLPDLRDLALDATYSATLRFDRRLVRARRDTRAHPTRLSVTVGGNASIDFLIPGLRVGLAIEGIDAEVTPTPFGGWVGEALAGAGGDLWVLWHTTTGATQGGIAPPPDELADIVLAARRLVERGVLVVFVLPEATADDDDPFCSTARWRRDTIRRLEDQLPPEVVRLPVEHLQARTGLGAWAPGRYWDSAKCPCHPNMATMVGREAARVAARAITPCVKAVAVDLDGTLWGGVVGDDGPERLVLDPGSGGRPYLQLQWLLRELSGSGVPLCVVSKNDPATARRPFEERSEMVLRLDDIVIFDASWGPKYEAIQRFATQLNIGVESICLLDDSEHERLEAATFLPSLVVPDLDPDPERRVGQLRRSGLFFRPVVTAEDRTRVDFYRSAVGVDKVLADTALDHDGYLVSLSMTLHAEPVCASNLTRVVALLHKTNQFNLTTRRHAATHVAELAADSGNYAVAFRLADRLGDAGIIGVVLGEREGDELVLDTWLLSCRVFNRGVENAMADHLNDWSRHTGIERVRAHYEPTAKNALVAGFYDTLGMDVVERKGGARDYQVAELAVPAHHLRIEAGVHP